ncbi:hypothetical protein J6590_087599 [Homalodisca vitripennis]|nr:hypothetical protein J6590_087599 [Homalodisca vitripennis]
MRLRSKDAESYSTLTFLILFRRTTGVKSVRFSEFRRGTERNVSNKYLDEEKISPHTRTLVGSTDLLAVESENERFTIRFSAGLNPHE